MEKIMKRAHEAVDGLRADAVLAGFSFGAGVAGELLPDRRATAGFLILHSIAGEPQAVRPGLPIEVHIADPDEFDGPDDVKVFTDPGLPDYGAAEAELTWRRSLQFIDRVTRPAS
jgi:hypothetical protein